MTADKQVADGKVSGTLIEGNPIINDPVRRAGPLLALRGGHAGDPRKVGGRPVIWRRRRTAS